MKTTLHDFMPPPQNSNFPFGVSSASIVVGLRRLADELEADIAADQNSITPQDVQLHASAKCTDFAMIELRILFAYGLPPLRKPTSIESQRVAHSPDCPVVQSFIPGVMACTCDFAERLAEALGCSVDG